MIFASDNFLKNEKEVFLTNEAKKILINDIPLPNPSSQPYFDVYVGAIQN